MSYHCDPAGADEVTDVIAAAMLYSIGVADPVDDDESGRSPEAPEAGTITSTTQ